MHLHNPLSDADKKKWTVAAAVAAGLALVGGIVYASSKKATPTNAGPEGALWSPLPSIAKIFTAPGQFRLELVSTGASGFYPDSNAALDRAINELGRVLPGIMVTGLWYARTTDAQGVTQGPFSFPAGTPVPADWPLPDGLPRLRIQFASHYIYDERYLTALVSTINAPGLTIKAWRLSGSTGPSQDLPMQWNALSPDAQGNFVLQNAGVYRLIRDAIPNQTIEQSNVLQALATLSLQDLDHHVDAGSGKWLFDVFFGKTDGSPRLIPDSAWPGGVLFMTFPLPSV